MVGFWENWDLGPFPKQPTAKPTCGFSCLSGIFWDGLALLGIVEDVIQEVLSVIVSFHSSQRPVPRLPACEIAAGLLPGDP